VDARERWHALQQHLNRARSASDAGDLETALRYVDAALALDPQFLAAQTLKDELVGALPSSPALAFHGSPPPTARSDRAVRAQPGVSPEGLAHFEARARQRRVQRRLEAARKHIAARQFAEARSALEEAGELDPLHPELETLTRALAVAEYESTNAPGISEFVAERELASTPLPHVESHAASEHIEQSPSAETAWRAVHTMPPAIAGADEPPPLTERPSSFAAAVPPIDAGLPPPPIGAEVAQQQFLAEDEIVEQPRAGGAPGFADLGAVELRPAEMAPARFSDVDVGPTPDFELRPRDATSASTPRRRPWLKALAAAAVFVLFVLGASWLEQSPDDGAPGLLSYPIPPMGTLPPDATVATNGVVPESPLASADAAATSAVIVDAGAGAAGQAADAAPAPETPPAQPADAVRQAGAPAAPETSPAGRETARQTVAPPIAAPASAVAPSRTGPPAAAAAAAPPRAVPLPPDTSATTAASTTRAPQPGAAASALPAVGVPVVRDLGAEATAPAPSASSAASTAPSPATAAPPPPSTAPSPAPGAPARTSAAPPPAAVPTRPNDEQLVRDVLQRYRSAYDALDARQARAVWPGVNESALQRAFAGLESQRLTFNACQVDVRGATARAICRGAAAYVPRVGSREPKVEPRVWSFTLQKNGEAWQIASARADR
jgi:hypothetical protein